MFSLKLYLLKTASIVAYEIFGRPTPPNSKLDYMKYWLLNTPLKNTKQKSTQTEYFTDNQSVSINILYFSLTLSNSSRVP